MRILVTGGNGTVGRQMRFGVKPTSFKLSVLSEESIGAAIKKYEPDIIVHLAAKTNMLACENNPKQAYELNVIGTRNVAKACRRAGVKLIYFSSGAVFGNGLNHPEDSVPEPLNVYGRTKLAGEEVIRQLGGEYLIVRTGWLFGGGLEIDKNFVGICLRKFGAGENMAVVADRFGSPTYVPDLLDKLLEMIKAGENGIVHIVNSGSASYFDIATAVKKIGNFKVEITPVSSTSEQFRIPVRAKSEALTSNRVTLRSWREALKEYISKEIS